MDQEKELGLVIGEMSRILDNYKARGFVSLGYPGMDHTSVIIAGDAEFAGLALISGVSSVTDRLDDDDKQSFLAELLMEVLDEIAALPDEKGVEMLKSLQQALADYQKVKAAETADGPKYEN